MDSNDTPPPPLGGFGSTDRSTGPAASRETSRETSQSGPPPASARVPPFAVASMIFGFLAIPGCWCWFSSLPLSFVGLAFGILALRQPRAYPGLQTNSGVAWAGIGFNVIAIVLSAVAFSLPMIHHVF